MQWWPAEKNLCYSIFVGGFHVLTCVGLLQKMLEYEPEKRITAHKALEHPYFNDVISGGAHTVNPRWDQLLDYTSS